MQLLLYKLVEAFLSIDEKELAKYVSCKAKDMVKVFDLWEYNAFISPLEVALYEKDINESKKIIDNMLKSMLSPWDLASSPLYSYIKKSSGNMDFKPMLEAVLLELEKDDEYNFLKEDSEYKEIIEKYKLLAK